MRLHRFFVKNKIDPKDRVVLRNFDYDSILSQWRRVFRYIVGSRVILFDGSGFDHTSIIESFDSSGAILRVLETNKSEEMGGEKGGIKKSGDVKIENNMLKSVTLVMSLIKNDNFDLVLQKATELGVSQIVPVIAERTIKKDLNMTRSQRILVESSEQCGRGDVPVITPVKKIKEALGEIVETLNSAKKITKTAEIGIFVCNQKGPNIKDVLGKKNKYKDLIFIIGPEGGWSPKEIKMFEDLKIGAVNISKNVLRAETAAIAVLAEVGVF